MKPQYTDLYDDWETEGPFDLWKYRESLGRQSRWKVTDKFMNQKQADEYFKSIGAAEWRPLIPPELQKEQEE